MTTSRRGRYVRVVVRDTGAAPAGEPPDHPLLEHVVTVEKSASPLDVAFVRAVAERHEGRFAVELAPGGGVIYALELPLPREEFRRALPPAPSQPAPSQPARARHAAGVPHEGRPATPAEDRPRTPPGDLGALSLPAAPRVAAAPPPSIGRQPSRAEVAAPHILVWPRPHEATARALTSRGWSPIPIQQPREVAEQSRIQAPSALLVDPLTSPVTKRMLVDVRAAAASARLPIVVAAGLGEVARDAASANDPAALIGALRPTGQRAPQILLLEDNPALAAAVGATLERRGMRPFVVRSEAEAMIRAAVSPPDLVLMDLALPTAPRPGILDWLRAQGRLPETPVVAFSAANPGPDRDRRLRNGETVLSLQPRPETPAVDDRIAELMLRLVTPPDEARWP